MLTTYSVLKSIHVLAAVIWVGGGFTSSIVGSRAARSTDPARMAGYVSDAAWIGQRVYLPASLVVLVSGVLAVLEGDWSFGDPWIGIGFTGVIVTALTGSLLLGPEMRRIGAEGARTGFDDPEVRRRIDRVTKIGRIDLVVLVVVVIAMVVKPGA